MSDYLPFDRPTRAWQKAYSFGDIYLDHCSEIPDADCWIRLDIEMPLLSSVLNLIAYYCYLLFSLGRLDNWNTLGRLRY